MDEIVVTAKRLPKHALSDAGAFYTNCPVAFRSRGGVSGLR